MESNKEFITRMVLFINELPEHKKRDYNTLLSFLDFQLKHRDNLLIEHIISNLAYSIIENVDFYGAKRIKKMVLSEMDKCIAENTNTFKVSNDNIRSLQQEVGVDAHRELIEKIKQETK